MYKYNIKITIRHLSRNKTYFGLQLSSLAIGIMCFLVATLFVKYEFSFDKHFKDFQSIYRITTTTKTSSSRQKSAMVTPLLHSAFCTETELECSRVYHWPYGDMMVQANDKSFYESKFFRVDSTFLKIFNLPLIKGLSNSALTKPNSVLISKNVSEKYFGTHNPINKIIRVNKQRDYVITGIFSLPKNSHLDFEFLAFDDRTFPGTWSELKVWFYIRLPNDRSEYISNQLNRIVSKYYPPSVASNTKLNLQPIKDIHLNSRLVHEIKSSGNREKLLLFTIAAILTAILTIFNFVNLATSRFMNRVKEIGIKKIHGASKHQLFFQFLEESIIISFCGAVLGLFCLILIDSSLPDFLRISNHSIVTVTFYAFLLAILVGITSGIYPSIYLAQINPLQSIKYPKNSSRSSYSTRSTLVGIQMTTCIIFLFMISKINDQLDYVLNKSDLIETDQIMVLNIPNTIARSWEWDLGPLKNELQRIPTIKEVSGIAVPWKRGNLEKRKIRFFTENELVEQYVDLIWVNDQDYHKLYDFKLLKGSFEIKQFDDQTREKGVQFQYVINQKAAYLIRSDQVLNYNLELMIEPDDWRKGEVVGVVEDFHYQSAHYEIKPLIFIAGGGFSEIAIQYSSSHPPLEAIKNIWSNHTDWPIAYSYLSEDHKNLYQSEYESRILLQALSIIVSALAMIGLYGLVSYELRNRRKDIAIRKVLGAHHVNLFKTLNQGYVKLFIIALFISIPLTFFLFELWSSNFVYTVGFDVINLLSRGIFIAAGISMITLFMTFRAIVKSPISELRNE